MAGRLILPLLSLTIAVFGAQAVNWPDLRVKYSAVDFMHLDSFFQQPRQESEAVKQGWKQPPETANSTSMTTVYCMDNDPMACMYFDKKGSLAGYHVAVPQSVDDLNMPGINYEAMGFEKDTLFGKPVYKTVMYFVPQDVIESGGRDFDNQTGTGLWLNIKGALTEIPTSEALLSSQVPKYVKQNCYDKMGLHYFYDVRQNMTAEEYVPYFLLYSNTGEMQGVGLVVFGSNTKSFFHKVFDFIVRAVRSWFELLPSFAVKMIAPDTPQWVLDYIDEYGPFSHHIYFVEKPWELKC